jgi:hypothetical protein
MPCPPHSSWFDLPNKIWWWVQSTVLINYLLFFPLFTAFAYSVYVGCTPNVTIFRVIGTCELKENIMLLFARCWRLTEYFVPCYYPFHLQHLCYHNHSSTVRSQKPIPKLPAQKRKHSYDCKNVHLIVLNRLNSSSDCFNMQELAFCPCYAFMGFIMIPSIDRAYFLKRHSLIYLFAVKKCCVFFEAETEFLNIVQIIFSFSEFINLL